MYKKILDHIKEQDMTLPKSAISISLFAHISEILCFNRVKIKGREINCYPNIYGITFMPSGAGKDYIKKLINDVTGFDKYTKIKVDKIYKDSVDKLENSIKEKIANGDLNKNQSDKYRKDNEPRYVITNSNNGTVEGMLAMRETLEDAGMGHCNFSHSEFGRFILNKNNDSDLLLTYLMEAYDGNTSAKVIKGQKRCRAVEDIPQTMSVHSSFKGLIDDNSGSDDLKTFIDVGLGRRCFICYPRNSEYNKYVDISSDYKNILDNRKKKTEKLKESFKKFYDMAEFTKMCDDTYYNSYKTIEISDEAEKIFYEYFAKCKNSVLNNNVQLAGEKANRGMKMIKLAGILAFLNGKMIIDVEEINSAIAFTDGFGLQMQMLYTDLEQSLISSVYKFILENPNCSKTEIRDNCIKDKNNTKLLNDLLLELDEYCNSNEMILNISLISGKYRRYSITKPPEHEEIKGEITCKISQAKTNSQKDVNFSNKQVIPFDKLHEVIKEEKGYSPVFYKDNHRKLENWEGGDNLLILDIDNDNKNVIDKESWQHLSIEAAMELFKNYKFLLCTTRNHNKIKHKGEDSEQPAIDRFRLVFPTKEIPFMDKDRYINIMGNLIKTFNIGDGIVDNSALNDPSRFYFGHNGEHYYSNGEKMLNWEVFDYKVEHQNIKVKNNNVVHSNLKNVRANAMFTLPNKSVVGWEYFNNLKPSETKPVYCTDHTDKNPSAFVCRGKDGEQNLHFKCSGCNVTYFQK